jgi:hypothetical protein
MQQSDDDDIQKGTQMIIASVQYTSLKELLEKVTKLERENEKLLNNINKNNQLKEELLRTIQKAEETLRLYEDQVQQQQLLPGQFLYNEVSDNNTTLPSLIITNEQQQQIKPTTTISSKQQRKKTCESTHNDQQKQQPTITSTTTPTTNKRMKPLPKDTIRFSLPTFPPPKLFISTFLNLEVALIQFIVEITQFPIR